jgi:hypothetical protein
VGISPSRRPISGFFETLEGDSLWVRRKNTKPSTPAISPPHANPKSMPRTTVLPVTNWPAAAEKSPIAARATVPARMSGSTPKSSSRLSR